MADSSTILDNSRVRTGCTCSRCAICVFRFSTIIYPILHFSWGVGVGVVQWCWVNFQCRGVLLIWLIVGQGPRAYCACNGCGLGLLGHFYSRPSVLRGGLVVRWCWVNFQCRGVLLIWIIVGQGPTALAVGAGGGCLDIFLSYIISLFFLPLFGRRPDIDWNTVSKGR